MLFNDRENSDKNSEPGPKRQLAILSRVPLSQIFDKLEQFEQASITDLITPIMDDLPNDIFKLFRYNLFDETLYSPTLTIQEWYNSIIDRSHRRVAGDRSVDLMSPPPGLEGQDYSMGLLDMEKDSAGFPLIEVRGYANLEEVGILPKINDTKRLVTREANWFFDSLLIG